MRDNEEMIQALRELVEIKSVTRTNITEEAPLGTESLRALNKALDICKELGFETKNCDNLTGWAQIGEGEEIVGILVHLDVVPEGTGWDTDPFELVRKDGKLIGRGTVDDKGPAVSCIYAMKDILDSGVKLNRRIRIIFGISEEKGAWDDMNYYKAHEELPAFGITPDADFPAIHGEKGILNVELSFPKADTCITEAFAGTAINVVPEDCEISYKAADGQIKTITKKGKPAHGSLPHAGINAVTMCMEELNKEVPEDKLAKFYMEKIGWDVNGNLTGCGFKDEKTGLLTMNVGMIRSKDDCITLDIDVRCPIDCDKDEVLAAFKKSGEPYGVSVKETHWKQGIYTDVNDPVLQVLLKAYGEVAGVADPKPETIGGGTYARAMDHIVAFGAMHPGRECTEHMNNEYMPEEDFILNRKIYAAALERLANV